MSRCNGTRERAAVFSNVAEDICVIAWKTLCRMTFRRECVMPLSLIFLIR